MNQVDTNLNFDQDDEIDLQQILTAFRRNWWLGVLIFGSVLGLTAYWTYSLKPVYQATSKVLLKDARSSNPLSGLSDALGGGGLAATIAKQGDPLATQGEILQSQPLVRKVIDQLNLTDEKTGEPLSYDDFLKNLSVKPVKGADILSITYKSTNKIQARKVPELLVKEYIQNDIQTSRQQSKATREFIQQQLPKTERNVINAEAALRKFKEQNQVTALQEEAKASVTLIGDLTKEITTTQAQFEDVSAQTNDLQRRVGLDSKQAVALSTLSQAPAVQQAFVSLQKVQDELTVQRTRYRSPHPIILELERKQAALQEYLQDRVAAVLGKRENASESDLQMTELQRNLIGELIKAETARAGVYNRLKVLSFNYNVLRERSSRIPRLEEALRQLERKLAVAQGTYESLLKSLQEANLIENRTIGNASIVSPSLLEEKPISPKILLNLALGGVLGLILAAAAMLLVESRDIKVRDREQLRKIFGYPFLGSIPHIAPPRRQSLVVGGGTTLKLGYGQSKQSVVDMSENGLGKTPFVPVLDDPYSPIANEFQKLQTNLRLVNTNDTSKVLVISSTMPGEGKSTVTANLGAAMAQAGHKVVIVDADMRKPSQHEKWQVLNISGLSNILAGMADFEKVSQKLVPNLDLITAGTSPPNPVALLESQRMELLLSQLSEAYDYVLVDSPPMLLVADAMIVTKHAAGLILVARPEVLLSTCATTVKASLQQAKVNVLGIVVNAMSSEDARRYGYGYGYGYKGYGSSSYGSYGGYGGYGQFSREPEAALQSNNHHDNTVMNDSLLDANRNGNHKNGKHPS